MDVEIGDQTVRDAAEVVARYCVKHEETIRNFDLFDQDSPHEITPRDVLATKHVRSRISGSELQFFVDRGRKAPWHQVPVGTRLADADPAIEDGLYDEVLEWYRRFYRNRQRGLSSAKIHKVLHLKRPALVPMLDGRLEAIYREQSREISRSVRDVRRGRHGRLYWAAIREDLLRAGGAWNAIRDELTDRGEPEALATQLTDVRLHDILAWELVPTR